MFTGKTLELLTIAGWNENRRYDTSDYSRLYSLAGCPPPPTVSDFLSRFGGLQVLNLARDDTYAPLSFEFDALARIRRRPLEYLCTDYDEIFAAVGLPILTAYQIGSCHEGHIELVMVETGIVYGYFDPDLWLIGTSGETAIETLCEGRKLVKQRF